MQKETYITEFDKERLKKIIDTEISSGNPLNVSMKMLDDELESAKIVPSRQIPKDIVTMNSRALLYIDDEEMEISLVFPEEADWRNNKLSVLSPIGTAILGYRVGDTVKWQVPYGVTHIRIKDLLYQPEACGDYHL